MVNDCRVNDDTWDTAFIAATFVSWHTEPSADDSYIPMTEDEAQEVFDRWLNEELAKAWDAGQQSGAQWGVTQWDEEGIITSENPYRKAD